jgi:hypothetical protein
MFFWFCAFDIIVINLTFKRWFFYEITSFLWDQFFMIKELILQ